MNRTLTVAMAAYKEFDSVYFTVQGLRAHHGDHFDILVVDNAPDPCRRTQSVVRAAGGTYVHRPDLNGTSRPRDACFQFATTPWVLVCDSHVLFETGAIAAAIEYAQNHPDSRDIVSGPIIGDDGQWISTHWNPAREAPRGLWGAWGVDDRGRDRNAPPFEIPMMGLGCFMMRTDAWPGFHHLMRGFGGEEGYIHEKVRRLGGQALCLPALRWRHKFRDIVDWGSNPIPYPAFSEDHIRNLLIGHCELGVEGYEELIRDKFGKKIDPAKFQQFAGEVRQKVPFGKVEPAPKRQRLLGVWYSNNSAPESLLRKSLESVKTAAEQSRHDVEIVTVPWQPIPGNPFREHLARHKVGPGHLNIIRQIGQALRAGKGGALPFDGVCFLEHDVLYAPGYFDRIGDAFARNPQAPVVSHQDYIGLNGTGWLAVRERHEPLHQLAMRTEALAANLHRAEADCQTKGWAILEPDADPDTGAPTPGRDAWVRIPPDGFAPSVHVNHEGGRASSHGEVVFEPQSTMGAKHAYWGEFKDTWPHAVPPAGGGCGCQSQATPAAASLEEWYTNAKENPSDFHEHVETLKELAARCGHATQIGSWGKSSRQAIAAGLPAGGRFTDYSTMGRSEWKELESFLGDRFAGRILLDGQAPDIDPTDLLFHDTQHTAAAVYGDLDRVHGRVNKYIVIHTTETFGEKGDDGGPGVMPGIRRFLKEHPEWTAVRHDKKNHGLIVLSKVEEEKKQPPGTLRKALNFAKALAAHAQAGQKLVSDQKWELRMAECLTCPNRHHDTCGLCGCPVEKKTSWAEQSCPADPPRWGAE